MMRKELYKVRQNSNFNIKIVNNKKTNDKR